MSEKVAIVAAAQTKFEQAKPGFKNGEIIWEVVEKVIQETGLKFESQAHDEGEPVIDKIVDCSEDYWQGTTISDCLLHMELGALEMDLTKVAADSAQAVYHAVLNVLSGKHDIILVVAYRKESEVLDKSVIENAAMDPIYMRPLGFDFLTAAAMQARRYMYKYGITREQCAKVVVKNRGNAKRNPFAQEPLDLGVADVLNSKMLADPITLLDSRPISDGACALILTNEANARRLTDKPVWITGIGNCYDAHYLGDRDLAEFDSLTSAAGKAYKMAGIQNPSDEIDVAEISDEFSYQELLWSEALGFCNRGEGGALIDSGITEISGSLPVNPSGGLLSGNPSGVAGMVRVAEGFLQLRGEAGERQVSDPKTALAHGLTGPCGQSHCVIILAR